MSYSEDLKKGRLILSRAHVLDPARGDKALCQAEGSGEKFKLVFTPLGWLTHCFRYDKFKPCKHCETRVLKNPDYFFGDCLEELDDIENWYGMWLLSKVGAGL